VLTAAALCPAPPLLARELTGADPVVPELRAAAAAAAAGLAAARPDVIAVVGPAAVSRAWDPAAPLDLSGYSPRLPGGGPEALPLPLGLGVRLLDEAGYAGPRVLRSVAADEPPAACAALGAELAGSAFRVALLVMADGSARRGLKAPGHLDERSAAFDERVERAVATGNVSDLLGIDPELADELMAAGRPAWQVLAGAVGAARVTASLGYTGDPFGVAYLVASLEISPAADP
jgi:hypothetical protein